MTTPPGYHTVTPRMVVADVAAAVGFLVTVFAATAPEPAGGPVQVRLEDSKVLVSSADSRALFPYVYVADVEAAYASALAAPEDTGRKGSR